MWRTYEWCELQKVFKVDPILSYFPMRFLQSFQFQGCVLSGFWSTILDSTSFRFSDGDCFPMLEHRPKVRTPNGYSIPYTNRKSSSRDMKKRFQRCFWFSEVVTSHIFHDSNITMYIHAVVWFFAGWYRGIAWYSIWYDLQHMQLYMHYTILQHNIVRYCKLQAPKCTKIIIIIQNPNESCHKRPGLSP